MASRHQRRKKAKALALVKTRQAIVRANLASIGEAVDRTASGLVSEVYANRMDRARGRGVTPMSRSIKRTISGQRFAHALGARATEQGCGWRVDNG